MDKIKNIIKDIIRPAYYGTKNFKDRLILMGKLSLPGLQYNLFDLLKMDQAYQGMYQRHIEAHRGVIQKLPLGGTILEVGCGTGYAIPLFLEKGSQYSGLDISETAIAVTSLKYPELDFYNLSIDEEKFFPDNTFDVIYCSSVLEHIGFFELAIKEMLRIAKRYVYILFFDGLSRTENHYFEFHPFTDQDLLSGKTKNLFGRKSVLQNHHTTIEAFIFKQPGNFYLNQGEAVEFLGITREEISNLLLVSRLRPWNEKYNFRSLLKEFINTKGLLPIDKLKKTANFIEYRMIKPEEKGFFMNIYSEKKIREFLELIGCKEYEILDSNNTSFLKFESVLIIKK